MSEALGNLTDYEMASLTGSGGPEPVPPDRCGRTQTKIGKDVTEQLDYIPGKLEVLRHIYPKYACSCCKNGVITAPTASGPIEIGRAHV